MAGEEGKTNWELNLDVKKAADSLEGIQSKLEAMTNTEGLVELASKMGEVGIAVAAVGAAVWVIKEAFDVVFDAEKIEAVNQQFDLLSRNAGVSGEKLKHGLEEASGGLIDSTTLMKDANQAMVALGASSAKLPDILKLARQASVVTGEDFNKTFNDMTKAVESGNTRLLRHMGIVIDQKKAYDDYARSIGTSADLLSQQGRQQAVLNALLEQGKTAFKGVDDNVLEATNNWVKFKTQMKEVGEAVVVYIDTLIGPAIKRVTGWMADFATSLKNKVFSLIGSAADQSKAKLEALKGKTEELSAADQAAAQKKLAQESINQEKLNALRIQGAQQLAKLKSDEVTLSQKTATSEEQVEQLHQAKIKALRDQEAADNAKNDKTYASDVTLRNNLKLQNERNTDAKIKELNQQLNADKLAADKRYADQSQNLQQGIARGWSLRAKEIINDQHKFAKVGEQSFGIVQQSATSMFEAIGSGSQSAGDAMKSFMFQALGGIAEAAGEMYLEMGIASLNPVEIAAGGALIGIGAWLKSQGGGGGSSPPSGGGGGGSSAASSATTSAAPTGDQTANAGPAIQSATPQHNITMEVHGNLYSSNEAKQEMMDLMRQATDATAYKYVQVGTS